MIDTPKNADEFEARLTANATITGRYEQTTMHMPCPFCAAADFMVFTILESEDVVQQEHTCKECKRSGQTLITREPGRIISEFVQTDGPNPPPYKDPAPRLMQKPQYG